MLYLRNNIPISALIWGGKPSCASWEMRMLVEVTSRYELEFFANTDLLLQIL